MKGFKSIYSHYYVRSDKRYPLPNGLHPELLDFLKVSLEANITKRIDDYETSRFPFNHGDFQHYFYNLYGDDGVIYLDNIIDDIENDDIVYVFPLEIKTTLESIISDITCSFNNQTVTYNVISSLPDKVIRLLQTKKIYLLLTQIQDPVFEEVVLRIVDTLKLHNIDSDRLHIISARTAIPEGCDAKVYRGIIPLTKIAHDIDAVPSVRSLGYLSEYVAPNDLNPSTIRTKKFLSFNRTARQHRVWLFYLAIKHNLLQNGHFSFIFPDGSDTHFRGSMSDIVPDSQELDDILSSMTAKLPCELDTFHLPDHEKGGFTTNNNKKDIYLDSYIHIVTETSFFESGVCYTEKILRPMANLQPFLIVGNAFSLKELRELGFKTFHPFINEEYDAVSNPIERMKLIENEIVRLNNMDIKDLHDLYYSLTDVLIHNRNHLSTYKNYNPFHIPLENMKYTVQRG